VNPATAVTVVIVDYNAGPHLERCVESVEADLAGLDWRAIVVDNASTDGSAATAAGRPRVTVLSNAINRGFGAAVNQAARDDHAPLLWLLNPDCRVIPGAFARMRETLERHEECAVTASQLLNEDGTTQESARGEPTALTGVFGRHGLLTRFFPGAAAARKNLRARELVQSGVESAVIDWAMGASLLIRRDVFDRVHGFDERYFLYWEDADLCRRIRALGYSVRYVPAARVEHLGAVSSKTSHRMATLAFHRSAYLYYATHTVPSRWHPIRWMAWLALSVRGWWRANVSRA
jgi:GT2 family glycosyltransferase